MRRELEIAFRNTGYRVFAGYDELVLRVDQQSPALARLLRESGARCAALLTAFNPGGRRQLRFGNRQSQRRLRIELARLGYAVLEGRNEDSRGRWPAEASVLVVDLPLSIARRFAARYGQTAFLWTGTGGLPQLIETAAAPRN
jgi:hypothetical protein